MSFEIGTASGHSDLLDRLNTFLTAKGSAFGLSYAGTGDGTFTGYRGGASSVAETFTIEATSSTNFTVTGSVSGSIGPATVGTPFAHAKIEFTITAGGVAFISGDTFIINTAPKWTALRAIAGSEMIWKAPGKDGAREIFVGALAFSDVSADYYNLRLGGFIGYEAPATFANQPGAVTRPILPLRSGSIPYWFVANGSSVRIVALVSTVYESAYLGFINAYASPGEWAYPLAVGGSMSFTTEPAASSVSWRWSNSGTEHRAYVKPAGGPVEFSGANSGSQLRIRTPDGEWRGFGSNNTLEKNYVWPYISGMSDWRNNLDGSYPRLPIVALSRIPVTNTWGSLEGVYCFTGHALAAESPIDIGRDRYILFPDVFRSTRRDYYGLHLD